MDVHSIEIDLGGRKLEVEYTEKFIEQIRKLLGMEQDAAVSEDLIVSFLRGELRSALEKIEERKDV